MREDEAALGYGAPFEGADKEHNGLSTALPLVPPSETVLSRDGKEPWLPPHHWAVWKGTVGGPHR